MHRKGLFQSLIFFPSWHNPELCAVESFGGGCVKKKGSLSDLKLANSRFLLVSWDVFYFPRPNKRHIYVTPLRSSYFVWLHYKRRYFPQSIPPMWLCLSVLQFVLRPDKILVSVYLAGTEGVLTINVVQKSTCLNWMEQHISSPTHSKCLYLSFTQSRHVFLNSDTSQIYSPAKSPAQIPTGKCRKKIRQLKSRIKTPQFPGTAGAVMR